MSKPLVTIGVTAFNAEDTVARALGSALAQTWRPIEIIVVDDASTDNTRSVIAAIAARHANLAQDWPAVEIVVVDDGSSDGSPTAVRELIASGRRMRLVEHPENRGVAASRNTILTQARGEFVAFFDDDDESLPYRICEQIRVLSDHEAATGARLVACYAGGERRYPNGYRVDAPGIGTQGPVLSGPAVAERLLVFKRQPRRFYGAGVPACALLARRATFEALGGFDPNLRRLQDVDFAIRLALRGGHFVGTKERLYTRYMTGGAEKSAEAELRAQSALVEKHRAYLESIGRYQYEGQCGPYAMAPKIQWYRLNTGHPAVKAALG